jgi:hypothetical protein
VQTLEPPRLILPLLPFRASNAAAGVRITALKDFNFTAHLQREQVQAEAIGINDANQITGGGRSRALLNPNTGAEMIAGAARAALLF